MNQDLREEYCLKAGKTGCLLIHGITGTPAELRELGEKLFEAGYTVKGVRLKGHGTRVEDMLACTYQDWIESAVNGYHELKADCDEIHVLGHSMGSLIALHLAEHMQVERLVTLSPPFVQRNKASNFAFVLKHFIKYANWAEREFTKEQKAYILGYSSIPISSVDEFNKLRRNVKRNLRQVRCPILIVHSKGDEIVEDRSVDLLLGKVCSVEKSKCILESSGHLVAVEGEKDMVFRAVLRFLEG